VSIGDRPPKATTRHLVKPPGGAARHSADCLEEERDVSAAIEKTKRLEAEAVATIARRALERIANGHYRNAEAVAADALTEMHRVGRKYPLQGLVGHPTTARSGHREE